MLVSCSLLCSALPGTEVCEELAPACTLSLPSSVPAAHVQGSEQSPEQGTGHPRHCPETDLALCLSLLLMGGLAKLCWDSMAVRVLCGEGRNWRFVSR